MKDSGESEEVRREGRDPDDNPTVESISGCGGAGESYPCLLYTSRDVQVQIVAVNQAAHEAEVIWHQILGFVHDEHALAVEL